MNQFFWRELFADGGHAMYVWAAFALVLVGLLVEVVLLLMRRRNIRRFLGAARWRRHGRPG